MAIFISLCWIQDFRPNKVAIFVDSLSALQALQNSMFKAKTQIIYDIKLLYSELINTGTHVVLEWIPSHVGIMGNELADQAAKKSLNLPVITNFIPLSKEDIKNSCKNFLRAMWQKEWETNNSRQLFSISPQVNFNINIPKLSRENERLLFKLRIGYIGLNKHLFKIGLRDTPYCLHCNTEESVEHFLLTCRDTYIHPKEYSIRF